MSQAAGQIPVVLPGQTIPKTPPNTLFQNLPHAEVEKIGSPKPSFTLQPASKKMKNNLKVNSAKEKSIHIPKSSVLGSMSEVDKEEIANEAVEIDGRGIDNAENGDDQEDDHHINSQSTKQGSTSEPNSSQMSVVVDHNHSKESDSKPT
jgi:hypothetical protein